MRLPDGRTHTVRLPRSSCRAEASKVKELRKAQGDAIRWSGDPEGKEWQEKLETSEMQCTIQAGNGACRTQQIP